MDEQVTMHRAGRLEQFRWWHNPAVLATGQPVRLLG